MTALEHPSTYERTERTTPARKSDRVSYDVDAVHDVLDEALYCHVSYVIDGRPRVLPTLHVRKDGALYLHGSTGAGMMLAAREGSIPLCVCVTILDGLVMARSWFNHSVNSRSVIVHGDASVVVDPDEKWDAMVALMEHVAPGRADGSRSANKREFAATSILRLPLVEVSLKVRSGPPKDDEPDLDLPHWAGIIPVSTQYGPLETDGDVTIPDYLSNYRRTP